MSKSKETKELQAGAACLILLIISVMAATAMIVAKVSRPNIFIIEAPECSGYVESDHSDNVYPGIAPGAHGGTSLRYDCGEFDCIPHLTETL